MSLGIVGYKTTTMLKILKIKNLSLNTKFFYKNNYHLVH